MEKQNMKYYIDLNYMIEPKTFYGSLDDAKKMADELQKSLDKTISKERTF